MQVLALADDATGALEVGAQFAARGVRTAVALDSEPDLRGVAAYDAAVIDAATRHLEPSEAARRISKPAADARALGIPHVYLKTDSTLRGPIAAEFEALLKIWPERALVYVPAYPAMGRTVVGARLFVDGLPLDETFFARDPLNPVRESSILRLLESGCRAPVRAVRSAEELKAMLDGMAGAIVVCDGREEADLEAVAGVLSRAARPYLVAGTGGFAGHWIQGLPVERRAASCKPRARRWLVVNGSLHPRSREQVACSGLPCIGPSDDMPSGPWWAVLATPAERVEPLEAARRLGEMVREAVERNRPEGLVIFGGDTARAILCALGEDVLEPCGELLPGIPLTRLPRTGLVVVSKAGGFGPPDVLSQIRSRWEQET